MKVIRIHESLLQSIVSDFITFGIMFSLWFLNHRFCGGSWIIDLCVALFVIISCIGKAQKKYTVKSAIEFLKSEEAQQYIIDWNALHSEIHSVIAHASAGTDFTGDDLRLAVDGCIAEFRKALEGEKK